MALLLGSSVPVCNASGENAYIYYDPLPCRAPGKPWRDDFYASKRLSAEHALLVIEISDTTIRYDHNRKMPLYAKAGVREPCAAAGTSVLWRVGKL